MIKCVYRVCCITYIAWEMQSLLPDLDLGKNTGQCFLYFFFLNSVRQYYPISKKSTQISLYFQIKLYQHIILNANNEMIFLLQGRTFVSDESVVCDFAYVAIWHAFCFWPYIWPWKWLALTMMDVPKDLFLSCRSWVLGYREHKNCLLKVGLANLCFQIIFQKLI